LRVIKEKITIETGMDKNKKYTKYALVLVNHMIGKLGLEALGIETNNSENVTPPKHSLG
jgi:hypothetical protein